METKKEEVTRTDIKDFVKSEQNQQEAIHFALQARHVMGRAWFTPEQLWAAIGEDNQKRLKAAYPDQKTGRDIMEVKIRVVALFGLFRGRKQKGKYVYRSHMTAIDRIQKQEAKKQQAKKID
jgi:hypothetical protein